MKTDKHQNQNLHEIKQQIIQLLQTKTHNFNGQMVNGINARHLHQALSVGRDYSTWIKARIKQGQFVENLDFLIVQNTPIGSPKLASQKGGNYRTVNEFVISVDMAKHLCLMEKTAIAHAIRQHFIEAERLLQQIAPEQHRALLEKTQQRLISIGIHKEMTEAVKQWIIRTGKNLTKQAVIQMAEAKLINTLVLGMHPDKFKQQQGITGNLREHFNAEQLNLAVYLETQNIALLDCLAFTFLNNGMPKFGHTRKHRQRNFTQTHRLLKMTDHLLKMNRPMLVKNFHQPS